MRIIFIVFLLFILVSPSIERIKGRDVEVELRSPPAFEFVLPPAVMEERIEELWWFLGSLGMYLESPGGFSNEEIDEITRAFLTRYGGEAFYEAYIDYTSARSLGEELSALYERRKQELLESVSFRRYQTKEQALESDPEWRSQHSFYIERDVDTVGEIHRLNLYDVIQGLIDAFGAYLAIKWQFFQAIYDYQKTLMELYLSAGKQPWIENE